MKSPLDNMFEEAIFNYLTTYQHDYILPSTETQRRAHKWRQQKIETPNKWDIRSAEARKNYRHESHDTFQKYKVDREEPAFNLLWTKRPIVETNPHEPYKVPEKHIVTSEEAIRTRPRLYMSPAVSVDDVPDSQMRKLLIDFMYTTDWRKSEREAAVNRYTVKEILNSVVENNKHHVRYIPDMWPPLPIEGSWRSRAKEWDRLQARACVDPTKNFWINRPLVAESDPSIPPASHISSEVRQEIKCLLKSNRLRLPHDKPMQGYTGYAPAMPYGCPLEQKDFKVYAPQLSVTQALELRKAGSNVIVHQGNKVEEQWRLSEEDIKKEHYD